MWSLLRDREELDQPGSAAMELSEYIPGRVNGAGTDVEEGVAEWPEASKELDPNTEAHNRAALAALLGAHSATDGEDCEGLGGVYDFDSDNPSDFVSKRVNGDRGWIGGISHKCNAPQSA